MKSSGDVPPFLVTMDELSPRSDATRECGVAETRPSHLSPLVGPHACWRDCSVRYEIITVAYRSREPLERLLAQLPAAIPVIVVDNSRTDEDISDLVAARPNTRYVDSGGNIGFGAACNLGAQIAKHPFLIFLNPDTQPDPAIFPLLVEEIEQDPACSSCGPALAHESHAVQLGAGGWQPSFTRAFMHAFALDRLVPRSGIWFRIGPTGPIDVEWVAGTCLVIRQDVFLEVGGFDPHYFLYQEDMDLGRKLRNAGYRQILRADLRLLHARGGSSSGAEDKLWSLRGRMLVDYIERHNTPIGAKLLRAVLGTGFGLRSAVYLLRAERERAVELWCYTRILL